MAVLLCFIKNINLPLLNTHISYARSLKDKIIASEAFDAGSIPVGRTNLMYKILIYE